MNREFPQDYKKVALTDLIALNELQEMQDSFAEVANVSIRTVDLQGRPVTTVSKQANLCSDDFIDKRLRDKICMECLPTFLGGNGMVDEELSFDCLPGLKSYLVPLKVSLSSVRSLLVGYMVIGPVIFMKRKDREAYQEIAEGAGFDLYQLWSLILELRVFSYKGIRSFLDMIGNLTNHILNLAYTKCVMQDKIFKDLDLTSQERSVATAARLSEFLELFLDLVIDVTRGETGSVMLMDRDRHHLVIKVSRGLSNDVVRKTAVKLGEGLSGLVAQTKQSLLINDNVVRDDIAERLKRPDLFSSVVVPIKWQDEVYGVVNLSSDRSAPVRFDEETLSFLTKAAGLAGVALERL